MFLSQSASGSTRHRLSVTPHHAGGGIVIAAIAVRLYVVTHFNINWDEFHYLSEVYDNLHGRLGLKLQSFHVHFFGWLSRVSINEADQIIAARAVMLGLHLVTAWLLYRIARRLTDAAAAMFAVAAYLSVSFVIWNGASFRSDPILTCLVMAALDLALIRRESLGRAAVAGLLLATATMITLKAALFVPSLIVVLARPLHGRDRARFMAQRLGAAGLTAVIAFALLYRLHSLTLHPATARSSVEVASGGLLKTLLESGLFPRFEVLVLTLQWDAAFWALWLFGAAVVVHRIWNGPLPERSHWLDIAMLALPVASLAVYRNAFSYFYPSILAPASVLLAVAWQALSGRVQRRALATAVKLIALTWFVASLIFHGLYVPTIMPLEQQRTVLRAIHRAFPSAVPYLDSSSMVASFPQAGFFMTTWGMDVYFQRAEPVIRRAIEERQPRFVVANHALLDPEHAVYPASLNYRPELLPGDREALAAAYIHHWGPIYVPGKRFEAGAARARIDLLIAGRYTLEAQGPVLIDGRAVQPGESVELTRGGHWVSGTEWEGQAILRWGVDLYRPAEPPPEARLFYLGF